MKLVAFVGKARAGKDTSGDRLVERFGFGKMALAGPLKDMLRVGLGLDANNFTTTEEKEAILPGLGFSYRKAAQTLGTEWGRALNDDLWLIMADRRLSYARRAALRGIAIIDMRFENEASWVRKRGGTVIHVESTRALQGMSAEAQAHVSESGVLKRDGDAILYNEGSIEQLHANVDVLAIRLGFEVFA